MDSFRTHFLLGIFVVRFVVSVIVALVITVVAFMVIPNLIQSGEIPVPSLELEFGSMWLPATVLGGPTSYVLGILLLDLMIVVGDGRVRPAAAA